VAQRESLAGCDAGVEYPLVPRRAEGKDSRSGVVAGSKGLTRRE